MLTIFLLLFFVFSILFKTDLSFDQDLGRHLKLGEIIITSRSVPNTNLFSYTNQDFPFINTHWLFEVIVFLASITIGLQALLFIKVCIFLISVLLILKVIPKENRLLLLPIGFIFLHVLRERLELRPEIFSFLFTAGIYFILEKFEREKTKLIFLLPLIQFFWINTHIYFFVGLVLQIIFMLHLEVTKLKLLGVIFGLSILVSLINPNGLNGLLFPLNVTKNYGYTIVENQTIFLLENISFKDPNFLFAKISFSIIILSLVIALIRKGYNLKNILLCLFGLGLALLNVRGFPYLVFISLPALLQNFGPVKKSNFTSVLTFFFAMLLIYNSLLYLNGEYFRLKDDPAQAGLRLAENGKKALDFVLNNNLPNPVFNNFDIGSYIIYRGYPDIKVFVDGRPEAYPSEFFTNLYIPIQSDYSKFKELEKKTGFKTIIFSHTDQTPWAVSFLQSVVKDESWKLVFMDDFIVIFVKPEIATQKSLKILDPKSLEPKDYKFDNHLSYLKMGFFLIRTENLQAGNKFIEKAAQIYPKSPVINLLRI